MNFWGNFNFNFGLGMNNWFLPTFSFPNFTFPPMQFPTFSFPPIPTFPAFPTFPPIFSNWSLPPMLPVYSPSVFIPPKAQNTPNKSKTSTSKKKSNNAPENLSLSGYSERLGERLANTALSLRASNFTGWCAKYVKNAIQTAGLGSWQPGHAYELSNILRNNRNFKEISPSSVDVSELPAGCVLVYDKGKEGYSSAYGHTEITTGDGRAVSDGVTNNLHKTPSAIFMPVERGYYA